VHRITELLYDGATEFLPRKHCVILQPPG
jgi:hypothetical protein